MGDRRGSVFGGSVDASFVFLQAASDIERDIERATTSMTLVMDSIACLALRFQIWPPCREMLAAIGIEVASLVGDLVMATDETPCC